ncbi:MAG: T9SS type A sorting domain-containing protein [Bacteroidota bacterium]
MKQTLLLASLLFLASLAYGQMAYAGNPGGDYSNIEHATTNYKDDTDLKIYPNPTVNHVHFNNHKGTVHNVVLFNLVGRPVKQFSAAVGKNQYDLTDLSKGFYLIQLMDKQGKVISTKRLDKR